MNKAISALALAMFAMSAGAQVTFVDGTERPVFANYNPNGIAATLGPVVGGREDAMINTTAGLLTATFLGFEALDTDTFTFTAFGDPWLNQQWGAQAILAAVFRVAGWTGLAVFRAALVGLDSAVREMIALMQSPRI